MTLIIKARHQFRFPLDLSNFLLDDCWNCPVMEVSRKIIPGLKDAVELGELFEVKEKDDQHQLIEIHPEENVIHGIGANLSLGNVIIKGNAGHKTGWGLKGGNIIVEGSVGDFAGAGMKKGRLHILKNSGDYLSAAPQGSLKGMTGGEIIVEENAGNQACHRMRRGLLVIKGHHGSGLGSEFLAGTIIIGNLELQKLGTGIRRGSIIALNQIENTELSGFKYAVTYQPTWWRVYAKYLQDEQIFARQAGLLDLVFKRFSGDIYELNKAELLIKA